MVSDSCQTVAYILYLWRISMISLITHTQPFYTSWDFVRDNPGELVPEETFTHSHLSWSSIIPYLLPPSITISPMKCFLRPVSRRIDVLSRLSH